MTPEVYEDLKRCLRFDEEIAQLLARLLPLLEPGFGDIVADSVARIREHARAASIWQSQEQIDQQRVALAAWLRRFFAAPRDAAYLARAVEIGHAHVILGLSQRYVVVHMNIIRTAIERQARYASLPDESAALIAIHRALDLDLAILLESYSVAELRRAQDADRRESLHRTERLESAEIFAAGLAHEIRNPLNGARLHLTFLRRRLGERQGTEPQILDAVDVASAEITRLSAFMTELLDFANPSPLDLAPTDLREVCTRAAATVSEEAEAAGVEVSVKLPAAPVEAVADRQRLVEVLAGVLRNSLEAITLSGARRGGRILLSVHRTVSQSVIEVQDSGPGILDPQAPLFEPFFTTKALGSGLGLSNAHRIVSEHDGTITFSSRPGCTVFSIKLPAPEAHPVSEDDVKAKRKVLVVDDEASARSGLEKLLQSEGYEVTTAADGAAALSVIQETAPEIVITDLRMPGMDGIELAKQLAEKLPHVPVIVVTAFGDAASAVKAMHAGVVDFITKPVDFDVLSLALERALARAALSAEAPLESELSGHEGPLTRAEENGSASSRPTEGSATSADSRLARAVR